MVVKYLQLDFESEVDFADGLYCPVDFLNELEEE